jgi:hypothetical protein
MIIAWTYLLHAYYRSKKIDYRYYKLIGKRKHFDKTKHGADKHWELDRCLEEKACPLDSPAKANLRLLTGLRHEIEHQMTTRIDPTLSAKFQACCLNFNAAIKKAFGDKCGIDKHLAFSLQFSSISKDQLDALKDTPDLPPNIRMFIQGFENDLSPEEFNNPGYAYRVLFVPKTVNHKGQADEVIEFVKADSQLAKDVNATYTVIKETERPKHLPGEIVKMMQAEGFKKFNHHFHTTLWKELDGKNPAKGYGVQVAKTWYWYEPWIHAVRQHCQENATDYR